LGKSLCKQSFSRFAQSGGIHRIQLPPNLRGQGSGCKGFSLMPTFLHFAGGAFASRNEPSATSCQQVMCLRISSPLKEIYLLIVENLMIDLQRFPVFAIYNSSSTELSALQIN
jgi:hypothetical protein